MIENVKINFEQEHQPNFLCNSYEKSVCNQLYLFFHPALLGSNQLTPSIPNYEYVFYDNNMEEHCFIARIMMENLQRKKELDIEKL